MVAGVPLIDLDRAPPAPVEAPPAGRRPWLLFAVIAAVLFTLSAAVPARPGLSLVLSVADPVTSVQLGAASFFLSTSTDVRRYALPAGTESWRREFDRDVQNLWADLDAGVVLVLAGGGQQLTALDAASGEPLWSAESPDTLVIATGRGGVLSQDGAEGKSRLRLTDARTGRTIWTRAVDPGGFLGPDDLYTGRSSWIVAVGSTGQVVVLSYADGSVLAEGDLGLSLEPRADRQALANFASVSVVGDRLYLSRRLSGQTSLTAYSLRPLRPVWRAVGGPTGTISDCGPVLCVADTRWVSAVDPAGGAVRWQQPAWGIAYRFDARRLFAYDNQEDAEAALLDAGTGRVVHPLGHSRQLGPLVLRTEGNRSWVLMPDPATGDLRTAGSMEQVAWFRCEAAEGYLVCPLLSGEFRVWQIR
ncbi:PQQ-binding-like beta-propeller repeat protein [Actinoplanes sp. CA-030573]|uniref:outer membrane protein assembly factor BamB family protein n=1 Tax=Actinoplanes sp. CA-030573 TaxID=3239898 RepID=UPI003D93A0F2